jgi:glutathione synthase/RimK-type ligase-like ATP-grasp enzyme
LETKLKPILIGDFYALDIGRDATNHRYFIFEANSAPGINENTVELYADYFIDKLHLKKIGGNIGTILRPNETAQRGRSAGE